jgi:23S rRNA (uridine2552-2'-O)-methyltransferase
MSRPKSAKSNRAWLAEHRDDEFVKRAQRAGYRSRAVYKLEEIDRQDHLLRPGMTVVDLGAAPGGWSQYVRKRVGPGGVVIAADRLEMEAVDGVSFLQGDFTDPEVLGRLDGLLQGRAVDLVISDMAPNISGVDATDQARAIGLGEAALEFACRVLKPGGALLVKAFQGSGFDGLRHLVAGEFRKLAIRKPKASRPRSREVYLMALGYKGPAAGREDRRPGRLSQALGNSRME